MSPRTTTVGGRRVRYESAGDGPPVVLLHGIGRSLEDWAEQRALLCDRFRVYGVDLPGFGGSDRLPGRYSLSAQARFVEDFLDTVGVTDPVHVVGNSLGGAVAMRLSVQARSRVRSLVLVASAGFGASVTVALRLLAIRPLGRLLLRPSRFGARRTELSLFADPAFATEARIRHALELARRPHAASMMLDTVAVLGTVRGVRPEWRTALLTATAADPVPTLVVWGDRDRVLPAGHLAAARAALPHARTHLFERTGHMPQIERADQFHHLVTDFWRDQVR